MSADLVALALHLSDIERRMQQLEADCAGCPGSVEPQDFALDHFPADPCPKRRRGDLPQGESE